MGNLEHKYELRYSGCIHAKARVLVLQFSCNTTRFS